MSPAAWGCLNGTSRATRCALSLRRSLSRELCTTAFFLLTPTSEMANDDYSAASDAFLVWLAARGIQINPKMALVDLRAEGKGRGISKSSHCFFIFNVSGGLLTCGSHASTPCVSQQTCGVFAGGAKSCRRTYTDFSSRRWGFRGRRADL